MANGFPTGSSCDHVRWGKSVNIKGIPKETENMNPKIAWLFLIQNIIMQCYLWNKCIGFLYIIPSVFSSLTIVKLWRQNILTFSEKTEFPELPAGC